MRLTRAAADSVSAAVATRADGRKPLRANVWPVMSGKGNWLGDVDSNHGCRSQNPEFYH